MAKEFPMMFKTEMVQAILLGIKNQTRRLSGLEILNKNPNDWQFTGFTSNEFVDYTTKKYYPPYSFAFRQISTGKIIPIIRKHNVGDLIWVKETWQQPFLETERSTGVVYKADYGITLGLDPTYPSQVKWNSSMLMPKRFARLLLEIVEYRIERLQSISELDAKGEGVQANGCWKLGCTTPVCSHFGIFKFAFHNLWDSINPDMNWRFNPWVNRIKFKIKSKGEN